MSWYLKETWKIHFIHIVDIDCTTSMFSMVIDEVDVSVLLQDHVGVGRE